MEKALSQVSIQAVTTTGLLLASFSYIVKIWLKKLIKLDLKIKCSDWSKSSLLKIVNTEGVVAKESGIIKNKNQCGQREWI